MSASGLKGSFRSCRATSQKGRPRTHALQQSSGKAVRAVIFWYLSVECPFNKIHGINRRPKLDTKLLDRFFHWRRQVSPPVNSATHRFFDGSQHFFYSNFTVGSRHTLSPLSSIDEVITCRGIVDI